MNVVFNSVNRVTSAPGPHLGSIAIVTPWFPNTLDDRKFTFISDSAASLARLGVAVHVLVCRPYSPALLEPWAPEWTKGRIDPESFGFLSSLEVLKYPALPGGRLGWLTDPLARRRICAGIRRLTRRSGAQLIHAHTEGLARVVSKVGRELKLPTAATVHGLNTDPRYLHAPAQRATLREALRATNRVILVGEPLRCFFADLVGNDYNFRVVHNGARLPVGLKANPIFNDARHVRFITVSNLHEGKGVDVALRALALARSEGFEAWGYTIIGDGAEWTPLNQLTKELGLSDRVRFVGAQPHNKIFEHLGKADIFVLPSYREAFGIAYLEAMAAGLVTIGVRDQGPAAFIRSGKTGFLVEPNNPRGLADCILEIIRHRGRAKTIGAAAADVVKREFTWDAHARKLMVVYRDLIASYA